MKKETQIRKVEEAGGVKFTARHGKQSVGFLSAVIHPDGTVWVKFIVVKDSVYLHNSTWVKGLRRVFGKRLERWDYFRPKNFRKQGVGAKLVRTFLDWCQARGTQEICGCITPAGLEAQPRLVEWYQMFGFQPQEPDERCLPQSVKMVVWRAADTKTSTMGA